MPIRLQGKEYVTHEELVSWAAAAGLRRVSTEIIHYSISPPEAIIQATAEGERGTFTGLGDCFPEIKGNVGRMISAHWIRMAETRAVNRALRLYTGRATTSIDELGERGGDAPRPAPRPAPRAPRPAHNPANPASWPAGAPSPKELQDAVSEHVDRRGWTRETLDTVVQEHFDGARIAHIWNNPAALADLVNVLDALKERDEKETA